jgi:hypothetical protein
MFSELSVLLRRAIDLVLRVTDDDEPWTTPWQHSQAGAELEAEEARRPEPETGSWPWLLAPMVARWALWVGVEESKALQVAVDPESTSYGADVLCRAVLESLSLGWWLLDPDIDAAGRLSRILLYRWHTASQTHNAIRHLGLGSEEDRSEYGELPEEVEKEARELGFPLRYKKTDGRRQRTCQEQVWPSYTERAAALVSNIWPQHKLPYAALSMVAHAELLGLTRNLGRLQADAVTNLRLIRDPTEMWFWHDTYLAAGALVLSAERAAVFLGLQEQLTALLAAKTEIQQALEVLRPNPT